MSRLIHVAVGVIVDEDGNILISKRPDTAHQGGLWEFPGGKVEPGEDVVEALSRELFEELAIQVTATEPLIKISHDYGDKQVLLDVHKVTAFSGSAIGNEGQPIKWVLPFDLHHYDFPAANRPIITAVNLPRRMLITGDFNSAQELLLRTENALQKGIMLVQLRSLTPDTLDLYVDSMIKLCAHYSAQLMVNCSAALFEKKFIQKMSLGLHLNSQNLFLVNERPIDPNRLLAASCHNLQEIEQAQKIGADFVCLSPVLATASHLNANGMGWSQFQQWVNATKVPVFALGGMTESHVSNAVHVGAQGVAAIREWW